MSLPHIYLIATGGTIAGTAETATRTTGYRAGSLGATALLDAVPEVHEQARFTLSQPFSLDSRDMQPDHWLQLAREVAGAIADSAVDAVLITHGTDTLEETAFFLDRVIAPGKPVVMTCAMRPASAHSADGPLNLVHAAAVALSPRVAGLGVLVVANSRIHAGALMRKAHTQAVDAFDHGRSPIGWADPLRVDHHPQPLRRRPELLELDLALPRVDVLWVGAGSDADAVAACVAHGARGLVLALPGNGSVPGHWRDAVDNAIARDVAVVRASRSGEGAVTREVGDGDLLIPARSLTPAQARVALMLALAGGLPADHFFD